MIPILVSLVLGTVFILLYQLLPIPFHPPADVLGNAHYWNIDCDKWFRAYWLWVLWPFLSIGITAWFQRSKNRRGRAIESNPTRGWPKEIKENGLVWITPFVWFIFYKVSQGTAVYLPDKSISYPWFPFWLALSFTTLHFLWIQLCRPTFEEALWLTGVPTLIFLLHAYLPGELGEMDFSHEGEQAASAALLMKGYWPWRDLVLAHGFLNSQLVPWLGFQVFEKSRWGFWAGQYLIVAPIYWVSLYLFCYYFFRKNRYFLFTFHILLPFLFPNLFRREFIRCALLLPTYIAFHRYLISPHWKRALITSGLSITQAVVTIEGGFIIPAIALAVIVFDSIQKEGWLRTIRLGVTGCSLFGLFCIFLSVNGALSGFINTYLTWGENYRYYSTINPTFPSGYFLMAAVIPLLLILVTPWYLYLKARITEREGVVLCALFFLIPYYQKYLNRPDQHVYHVLAVGFPLLYFILYEIFQWLDFTLPFLLKDVLANFEGLKQLHRFKMGKPFSLVFLIWLLIYPYSWPKRFSEIPLQFKTLAHAKPNVPKVGFSHSEIEKSLIMDLELFTKTYLQSGERVFDFSNQGGLVYFLLDREPATRYYYILYAIRRRAQREVIADLEKTRPRYAFFAHPTHWTAEMDQVPLFARHYELSQYLFKNYKPFLQTHDRYLYVRKDLTPPPVIPPFQAFTESIRPHYPPCRWGFAAHHFSWDSKWREEGERVTLNYRNGEIILPKELSPISAIEFEWKELRENNFELTNGEDSIQFWTLPKGTTRVKVPVASCPQWQNFRDKITFRGLHPFALEGVYAVLESSPPAKQIIAKFP